MGGKTLLLAIFVSHMGGQPAAVSTAHEFGLYENLNLCQEQVAGWEKSNKLAELRSEKDGSFTWVATKGTCVPVLDNYTLPQRIELTLVPK